MMADKGIEGYTKGNGRKENEMGLYDKIKLILLSRTC